MKSIVSLTASRACPTNVQYTGIDLYGLARPPTLEKASGTTRLLANNSCRRRCNHWRRVEFSSMGSRAATAARIKTLVGEKSAGRTPSALCAGRSPKLMVANKVGRPTWDAGSWALACHKYVGPQGGVITRSTGGPRSEIFACVGFARRQPSSVCQKKPYPCQHYVRGRGTLYVFSSYLQWSRTPHR